MRICDLEGCEKPHRARGLCATHYNQQRQPNRYRKVEVPCALCGTPVFKSVQKDRTRRYCSAECRVADPLSFRLGPRVCKVPRDHPARWFGTSSRVVYSTCERCGDLAVSPEWNQRKYCSATCRKRTQWSRASAKGGRRNRKIARRTEVFERDGYVCWLCKTPTDPDTHYLAPIHPTVDHVVPRNNGGSDDPANLRTAHRICNSTRRDQEEVTTMPPPVAA